MQNGRVIKAYNSFYYVQSDSGLLTCRLRGHFKKDRCDIVAGDFVAFEVLQDHTGIIEQRLPRRNLLHRPVVANIDQVVLTFSLAQPALHPLLLNRFLVMAEWSGIRRILICINKVELLPKEQIQTFLSLYEKIGYTVLMVSALQEQGIDSLCQYLSGNVSVFSGPSGVGKSTLLNAIDENLTLATGEISEKIQRGKHTTRLAQLLPFRDGFIVDTPGFSSIDLSRVDKMQLAGFFPEFRPVLSACKYNTCTHSHEPQCAVKKAVACGEISLERYEAYLAILQEIEARKKEYK
jgi:ribosome biogenesis GTPase / thiamine phosphate phosphatase